MHDQAWHDARAKGIGGSDWQHVLSIGPYGCPRMLWYQKIGQEPDVQRPVTGAMTRGHKLEQLVAEEYAEVTGNRVRNKTIFADIPRPEWWIGNIDRAIVGGEIGPGVLECKTVNPWRFRALQNNGPGEEWMFQIQHYLGLTGWNWGAFAILEPLNWQFLIVEVGAEKDLLDAMVADGNLFWDCVEGRRPDPPQLPATDHRCHRCEYRITCQGADLFAAVPDAAPGAIEDRHDEVLANLVRQRNEVRAVVDEATGFLETINTTIKDHLGGPCKVRCGGSRVYLITSSQTRIDTRALKAEQPEVAEKYSRTTTTTQLRIYPEE